MINVLEFFTTLLLSAMFVICCMYIIHINNIRLHNKKVIATQKPQAVYCCQKHLSLVKKGFIGVLNDKACFFCHQNNKVVDLRPSS